MEARRMKTAGRRKPYTKIGIRRLPCCRCGKPAAQQWQVCADRNLFRPLCTHCDIGLNRLVLRWMGDPDWKQKIAEYKP